TAPGPRARRSTCARSAAGSGSGTSAPARTTAPAPRPPTSPPSIDPRRRLAPRMRERARRPRTSARTDVCAWLPPSTGPPFAGGLLGTKAARVKRFCVAERRLWKECGRSRPAARAALGAGLGRVGAALRPRRRLLRHELEVDAPARDGHVLDLHPHRVAERELPPAAPAGDAQAAFIHLETVAERVEADHPLDERLRALDEQAEVGDAGDRPGQHLADAVAHE